MLRARIIACLDVRWGQTVKGVKFEQLRELGDPIERALAYAREGADEIVWLDVQATLDNAKPRADLIARLRQKLNIPLTVGGGITNLGDVESLLEAGADKVSINSRVLQEPALIEDIARRWGSQCVVVAVDAKRVTKGYRVFSHGGHVDAGWWLADWVAAAEERGAGEFLLTSMDCDGRQEGFDLPMLDVARSATRRPVIASGGAGSAEHIAAALDRGHRACLLASVLHEGRLSIRELKADLAERGYRIRAVDREWPGVVPGGGSGL
ncbi:imidazole glycerol phosphate synthase subunit HisF [Sulfobacillus harzensis]|uniref:Imidazole glycerol phosphate synthase subunit HisF n=1 Tax=Sulfobacillus harzensis TaxID=2729629 RepID=A0A7Y0Q4K8_9FIRM|nr:HisA/HisF-related TIM barrel protein [Sulfobacillus harzensis]NMP24737.1 imidazole glycerol phosphate synthase subunit HisF [Sulfobacillus harzensis]